MSGLEGTCLTSIKHTHTQTEELPVDFSSRYYPLDFSPPHPSFLWPHLTHFPPLHFPPITAKLPVSLQIELSRIASFPLSRRRRRQRPSRKSGLFPSANIPVCVMEARRSTPGGFLRCCEMFSPPKACGRL